MKDRLESVAEGLGWALGVRRYRGYVPTVYTVSEGVKLDQPIRGRVMNTSRPTPLAGWLAAVASLLSLCVRESALCPSRFSVCLLSPSTTQPPLRATFIALARIDKRISNTDT